MKAAPVWSRRAFLRGAGAAVCLRPALGWAVPMVGWGEATAAVAAGVATANAVYPQPLREGSIARPRRYLPEGNGWVIRNGKGAFGRMLYPGGEATGAAGFVVAVGDRPEVGIGLPAHTGTLRMGVRRGTGETKWVHDFEEVVACYRAGRMEYVLRDEAVLGRGGELELLVMVGEGAEALLRVRGRGLPEGMEMVWLFGGASERLASVGETFAVRPGDCRGNRVQVRAGAAEAVVRGKTSGVRLRFPEGATIGVKSAADWATGWREGNSAGPADEPLLGARVMLTGERLVVISRLRAGEGEFGDGGVGTSAGAEARLARRMAAADGVAQAVRVETPDLDLNAAMASLNGAVDAMWDEEQGAMRASAGGGRVNGPGWRGAWAMDALGQHTRMRRQVRFWLQQQDVSAVPEELEVPVRGAADAGSGGARKDGMLHTNGDVAKGREDQNLVFFDAVLRHLRWTGDMATVREVWPALLRHMDWEYRLFRRPYVVERVAVKVDGVQAVAAKEVVLPLYEGYECLPGCVGMAGNGGGSAHASAMNYGLNRGAAVLARLLNGDPTPFEAEAEGIRRGMRSLLWRAGTGSFAEGRDWMEPRARWDATGVWTAYTAIDAGVVTERQAWQVAAERLRTMRRVPVKGDGVGVSGYVLPATDWVPEQGAVLRTAECAAMAMALWQVGMADEAYGLLRGTVVEAMARGASPGGLPEGLPMDPMVGEMGGDSGDVAGVLARAVVEGLFGAEPDLLRGTLMLRPGFPAEWDRARLVHPEMEVEWQREGLRERFRIKSGLAQKVVLTMVLAARAVGEPEVLVNGKAVPCSFDGDAVGGPRLLVPDIVWAAEWVVEVRWQGRPPVAVPPVVQCAVGQAVTLPAGATVAMIDDPQGLLKAGVANRAGKGAVFVRVEDGPCGYWLPIAVEIGPASETVTAAAAGERYEVVEMGDVLQHRVAEMLTRGYAEPRSPFCSLGLPAGLVEGCTVDDAGLRGAGGTLVVGKVPFRTPKDGANCRFVSMWKSDAAAAEVGVAGRATSAYVLVTGTVTDRAWCCEHGVVVVQYGDGTEARVGLRSPETWWPVERDWLLDDYVARWPEGRAVPARVELRTGKTWVSTMQGAKVEGGAAVVVRVPLDAGKELKAVRVECLRYGVVVGVLGVTLGRV